MHGQPQAAPFCDQVAKNVILKGLVFLRRGDPARMVFLIDGGRGCARWIGKIERAEVAGLKLLGNAALLLVLLENAGNESEILIEAVGQAVEAGLLHIAAENFFLERDVHAFVGVFSRHDLVIEGEEERVREE